MERKYRLPPEKALEFGIASARLEGAEYTPEDMEIMSKAARGEATSEDVISFFRKELGIPEPEEGKNGR